MTGINIDDVLLELSYRTPNGIVDLTDPKQIVELGKILRENGVRNAYDIATMAGFNYSLLKEAKEETFMVGKDNIIADPSWVGKMDAEDFEVYAAKLFTFAIENGKGKLTKEQKAKKVMGVYIGHGEKMYNNICKFTNLGGAEVVKLKSKQPCSAKWAEWGAPKKVDTPKTDIIGGKTLRISVKKGDAQLMSGERKETMATIFAAAEHVEPGEVDKINADLKEQVIAIQAIANQLLQNVRGDQGLESGYLQSMRKIEEDDTLTEKERLEKIKELIAKINANFEKKNAKKGWSKSKGYQPIESFSETNMELVRKLIGAHKVGQELKVALQTIFEKSDFGQGLLYEAASGYFKFTEGTAGHADKMFAASKDGIRCKLLDMSSPSSPAIQAIKGKIKIEVSLKSGGYGPKGAPHIGYAFYESLRLHVLDVFESKKSLNEAIAHANYLIERRQQLLTEWGWSDIQAGMEKIGQGIQGGWQWFKKQLDDVIDAIKKGWELFVSKISELFNWITDAAGNILSLIQEGVYHIFGILNLTPVVSGDTKGKFNAEGLAG